MPIDGEAAVKFGRVWRDERGASALEFGLIAPSFFCSFSASSSLACCSGPTGDAAWSSDGRRLCQRQQDACPTIIGGDYPICDATNLWCESPFLDLRLQHAELREIR